MARKMADIKDNDFIMKRRKLQRLTCGMKSETLQFLLC